MNIEYLIVADEGLYDTLTSFGFHPLTVRHDLSCRPVWTFELTDKLKAHIDAKKDFSQRKCMVTDNFVMTFSKGVN